MIRSRQLGQRKLVEKVWRKFFSDPSQWWDHRLGKVNAKYPDFKHKKTGLSLWLDGRLNPPWVEAQLAAMKPGTLQLSTFAWNLTLESHVKAGEYQKTLHLFKEMQQKGTEPNTYTFVPILTACASLGALGQGRQIHTYIIDCGLESNVYVGSSLVDMYAKCGSIEDAQGVFDKLPTHDVIAWTAMILGHVKCGQGQKALEMSWRMYEEGVEPNSVTFVGLLNACASLLAIEEGRRVHQEIIQRGYESDLFVGTCLVDMYAKCGSITDACSVFEKMGTRDVVSWNAMIMGYVKCGQGQKALELSREMLTTGMEPNLITFIGMVNACACMGALEDGIRVHKEISRRGYESDIYVGSSLVDLYAKCGSTENARRVFDKMSTRNVVTWNAMILGYVRSGEGRKALELSQDMDGDGVGPDPVTFVGLLNACACIAALEEGRRVHQQITQSSCGSDIFVGNSLVAMYAKCGSIEDALRVFDEIPTRTAISWNAMLGGYAMHGQANEAFGTFEQMSQERVEMNGVTFLSLLSACSHGGLVDEGMHYFEYMTGLDIPATLEHYSCMVDLLGRAGQLHEAENVVKTMSYEPNATVWMCLLGACRVYGNTEMGEDVANRVLELEPERPCGYVLLSNIYAAAGKWDSSADVLGQRVKT